MARSPIRIRAGETEIVERRRRNSKTIRQADGKIRVVNRLRPVHWDNAGQWVEVDDTPQSADGGRTWTTPSTPYNLAWDSETLTLSYTSKKGGDVTVKLSALDGSPFTGKPSAVLEGQDIVCAVSPDLDIRLRVRSHGVEIFKVLKGPSAPKALAWEISEGDMSSISFAPMTTKGMDNALRGDLQRLSGDLLNRRRQAEIAHAATEPRTRAGRRTYQVTETVTGRTRFVDPLTRARLWVDEIVYPVEVDVTVSESIVANDDDGRQDGPGGYWDVNNCRLNYGNDQRAIWRFQTVDVPQGQVLDSATLTVNVTTRSGTGSALISGEDADDAPAWTTGNQSMTATTANTSWAVPGTTGTKQIDILTAAQEIVDRVGWAANNDMRFGFTDLTSIGSAYAFFEDYSAAGTAEGELEIVYTAGGGGDEPRTRFLTTLGVG